MGLYKCKHCEFKGGSPSKLKRHERIHSEERPFECSVCGQKFKRKEHLDNHKFVHTNTQPPNRACVECMKINKDAAMKFNWRDPICNKHKLCTTHAVQRGLISPLGRSPGSLAACRCFDEIERIMGIKINHIHYSSDDRSFSGKEVAGLIPGRRFAPDGIDHEYSNQLFEFLGTPWHGFPDPNHAGQSHTGKEYWQLHAQTMARINLFADHGFLVHYVWQSEWDNAKTMAEKLKCIRVAKEDHRMLRRKNYRHK